MDAIIAEEKLKSKDTWKFMENAFRDGEIKTSGTEIDKLMPPISRFGGGNRAKKKQAIIDKLKAFFERYFGIGSRMFDAYQKNEPEDTHTAVRYDFSAKEVPLMVAEELDPYGK